MKIAIVITGIICDYFLDELIECYDNCRYTKIISTWNYTSPTIIQKLKDNNFLIIQSDFPNNIHPNSTNYQNFSTKVGIEYAENIGITHILRMRADMKCNNMNRLLEIYTSIYELNKMIFLLHIHNDPRGYLIDYAHFGSIPDSKKYICHFQDSNDSRYPEKFRQETCFETDDFNIITNLVVYSGKYLLEEKIDFAYLKKEYIHQTTLLKTYVEYNHSIGFSSF
jgi:hypothetical protein